MKFETVRIYFLREFSVYCHPKILLPWQCDITTSPSYSFVLFQQNKINLHVGTVLGTYCITKNVKSIGKDLECFISLTMWVLREKVTLTLLVIINFHGSSVAC